MNGQSSKQSSTTIAPIIDAPTVYDISEALHRLADFVGEGRVRFTDGIWIVTEVDWAPHTTDIILDVLTHVSRAVIERNDNRVVTRYTGYLNGIYLEFRQGVRVTSSEVKPT